MTDNIIMNMKWKTSFKVFINWWIEEMKFSINKIIIL